MLIITPVSDLRCIQIGTPVVSRRCFLRHHIFDLATGRSPQELASVTVVAPSGLDADGASTAVMVLGAKRGMKLLESFPGAEAFLVLRDGGTIKTPRFPET